jgi:hypothetical protein
MKFSFSDELLIEYVTKAVNEFYELCYKDPWFKKIFRNIEQELISTQQIDFMVQSFGGSLMFSGRIPKDAHPHVWIDEDIWAYREKFLIEAFQKTNIPEELKVQWLRIDEAFKKVVMNTAGPEQCKGRYKTDEIIYEPMPDYLKKKAS